jgi:hypothetical protein
MPHLDAKALESDPDGMALLRDVLRPDPDVPEKPVPRTKARFPADRSPGSPERPARRKALRPKLPGATPSPA